MQCQTPAGRATMPVPAPITGCHGLIPNNLSRQQCPACAKHRPVLQAKQHILHERKSYTQAACLNKNFTDCCTQPQLLSLLLLELGLHKGKLFSREQVLKAYR